MSGPPPPASDRPPVPRDPRATRQAFLAEKIDPRALLGYLTVTGTLAFCFDHPAVLAVLATTVWVVVISAVPERQYLPYLIYGAAGGLLVLVLNPLASQAGSTVLLTGPTLPLLGTLTVSAEAVAFGVSMMLRLLSVTGVFALYACVVDADALFRLIAPLSPSVAVVLALSVRLFPVMANDAARISDAQRCRGQRLASGSWLARARAGTPVLGALVTTSLERAFDTAEALESRGFGRAGRTRLPGRALARRDFALLAASVAALLVAAVGALGPARFVFYPRLADPATGQAMGVAVLLGGLVLFPSAMAWGWARWHWLRSRI